MPRTPPPKSATRHPDNLSKPGPRAVLAPHAAEPRPLALGVDLVEVARIAEMLRDHPDRFLTRCFTPAEAAYATSQPRRRAEHLAARFAAKEAVMKALGTGLSGGITWRQIEVLRLATGAPALRLTGRAAAIARQLGLRRWLISLSHTRTAAIASVIATA